MTNADIAYQGSLFSQDFLTDAIARLPEWDALDDAQVEALRADLVAIYGAFPTGQRPNESQTEDDLIWRVLVRLGWTSSLRQQNLAVRGREDVPDGILFENDTRKAEANAFPEEWRRYQFGLAIVESKRWQRPLDRSSGRQGEELAPSTQMLRYLRRVEDLTTGNLRWGILTNGARFRLYYQGARSVSEQFFDLDLAMVLGIEGHEGGLFALEEQDRAHWLKVFALIFRREAFLPSAVDVRTFHQRALEEGKFYEERVAENLSNLVFGLVFPYLAKAIAAAAPPAGLHEVRDAALILLYRLLFVLYAEDRDLLPVRDRRYDDYALRERVRGDVGQRKDNNDTFSETAARYWSVIDDLCRALNTGDASIGVPPYNGGLFDPERTPLLTRVRLGDAVMAEVIDALSFERTGGVRKYINYRDLSVQQLGSIYERLLEHELSIEDGTLVIRPNIFARKGSGSYYTPEDLVALIIRETLEPLVDERMSAFTAKAEELEGDGRDEAFRLGALKRLDPAERLLELKVCDPAMGSGHFLVNLVDYLADQVIAAMAEAQALVVWADYVSPLAERIDTIRNTILQNAEEKGWTIEPEQLDDRHIIRRMVLKRCVYGVDKNLMAVELAKVSLWLHTFTVGAPLSFLDHHLRCGDSLFGEWVSGLPSKIARWGGRELFLVEPLRRAKASAASMQTIEGLTDAEIAEAHRSAEIFAGVQSMIAPLDAFMSVLHALEWLDLRDREDKAAVHAWLDGVFGDPIEIARGTAPVPAAQEVGRRFAGIMERLRELIAEERFLNWQVAFPGVWTEWEGDERTGGFDAVVGNPPWDRMKLEQIEWFAIRRREIAMAQKAADRKRLVAALEAEGDPLAADYAKADARAEAAARISRQSGEYPLLASGDLNIYALFVERARAIAKNTGMVGLLTPSGIAADKNASAFFKDISTHGNLKSLFDFENKRPPLPHFFPDIHPQAKFVSIVFSAGSRTFPGTRCAFFLKDVRHTDDPNRSFVLQAADFVSVNPNTGTAPIFRTRRDAEITTAVYSRLPVLVDRREDDERKAWDVDFLGGFHMTSKSDLFRTRQELEERENAFPTGNKRFESADGKWIPLYEGKMIWHFDHRAASILINPENQYRPAYPRDTTPEEHADPAFFPEPQFWINATGEAHMMNFALAFRDVTNPTDRRTMDAAIVPHKYAGNTLPILKHAQDNAEVYALLCANLNAIIFDYIARQKVQKNHLNWYIVEQLPVVPEPEYDVVRFGDKTAREIVIEATLELTYTAEDMRHFAEALSHEGDPFPWDEDRRAKLMAKLNALFFLLYGMTERQQVEYVFSTFGVIRDSEIQEHGSYKSCKLCLAYLNALQAGRPDAEIELDDAT